MTRDPTDIRGNERRDADAKEQKRVRLQLEQEDLRAVMRTVEGRRFIRAQLARCGVWRTSFTGNSETFFREGQRNIGLMLLDDLHSSDELLRLWHQAEQEHSNGG